MAAYETLGHIAYAAYWRAQSWTALRDQTIARWATLPSQEQAVWEQVAQAVRRRLEDSAIRPPVMRT